VFRFSVRSNRAHLIQWREWGGDAFQEVQEQNKPVALFITAFWCGFCQRMDEAALSDDEVIALLNAFFVPIRVEESQRPDVDLRYNQNGWPTIAFLTPDGDHLFSVNYMDTDPFVNLLVRTVKQFQDDRASLVQPAAQPSPDDSQDNSQEALDRIKLPLGPPLVAEIAGMVEGLADPDHGGYGTQFKFLHPEANDFLLYLFETTGEAGYLDHVVLTLDKMRGSRTFDEKDGGFFRYSSQPDWNEPHLEKLLEDQAALLSTCLHAYLLTEDPAHRETAEGLSDYLNSILWDGAGGAFFGCQDYVRPESQPTSGSPTGPELFISVIDNLVYCDANARAASACLEAWWVLGRDDCRARAQEVLELLWGTLRVTSGGMYHYSDGEARAPGMLADSVASGTAFLSAYAVLHEPKYLSRAQSLAADIVRMHRSANGGFLDITEAGPASLKVAIPVLTQNAAAAAFFVRLADLSGEIQYREEAVWALRSLPNAHRQYGAFAAGFGQALARLLALPLVITVNGLPGDPGVRALARAALTQLGHGDLVLRFREDRHIGAARADINSGGRDVGSITDPAEFKPDLVKALQ